MRLLSVPLLLLAAAGSAPAQAPAPKAESRSWEVPYRLTASRHVMVRARINGAGPFNFIVDSGAPAVFLGKAVCEELGVKGDEKHWGTLDAFEIEGGPKLPGTKVRVEDMFQLEGMNKLGLAGVKLHGVIGYSVLGKYRLEFDFTRDAMTWTELDYEPAPFKSVKGKAGADLTWVGTLAKGLGTILGTEIKEPARRGYLGVELGDTDDGVRVSAVLEGSPAAAADLRAGDLVTLVRGRRVRRIADVLPIAVDVPAGGQLELTVVRGAETKTLTVTAGEGL